jgi:uncharacterized membrane protein YphA (DoxX/SURF4 family)
MSNDSCKCCSPQAAAVALGRWCLGVMFFFAGLGKFQMGLPNFWDFMAKQFAKTWLPGVLLTIFSHVLPFAEVTLGVLLVLGLIRSVALFGAGVLLILLTFGQVIGGQPQIVFFNTGYLFMAAALLFLAEHDRWVLFPRPRKREASSASPPQV